MSSEFVGIKVDFKDMDDKGITLRELDQHALESYPTGFLRNCSTDEKIAIMQQKEFCPTHCLVKRGIRLYLELTGAEFYSEEP